MLLSKRLEDINKEKDYVKQVLEKLKNTKNIVIFGAGDRAKKVGKFLLENGIYFDEFWVSKEYYKKDKFIMITGESKPVKCFDNEVLYAEDVTLILGVAKSLVDIEKLSKQGIKGVITISLGVRDDYLIDYEYFLSCRSEFDKLYEMLEDDYSRECLYSHLVGRLTGKDVEFVPSAWSNPEYILDDLMVWNEKECYVDCGAYVGDSVLEFLKKKPNTVKDYLIYALEPDANNFKHLQKSYEDNKCILPVCKGAYSKKSKLLFESSNEVESKISEKGDLEIQVDTIDNILGANKATFIKMDIEGSELEALYGAKGQITENKPRLAICVYHKKEDLITIPQYIYDLNQNYKFYLRTHSSMPTELVLFCL